MYSLSPPRRFQLGAGIAFLSLLLSAGAAGASSPELSSDERSRLEKGTVLVSAETPPEGNGVAVRGVALVEAPPASVWPVVRDCEHFSDFMPRTRESLLLERDGPTSVCRIRVDMPFPFGDLVSESRSVDSRLGETGFQRSWAMLRGDYEHNEGSWKVLPWDDDPTRTLLIYEQRIQPKFSIPDMMMRAGQRRTLPDAFRAIRQRVASPDVAAGPERTLTPPSSP